MDARVVSTLLLLAGLTLAGCTNLDVPNRNTSLESKIAERLSSFHGRAGVYVEHLQSGQIIALNADTTYPTASLIKVPIMAALFDRMERDTSFSYHTRVTYEDSLYYAGEDLLGSFKPGESLSIAKLVLLMITMSDNTASLWCQLLAGTGTTINTWLETNGFEITRVNSRTPGREPDRERFGWGQTSPREMASLFKMIRRGEAVSPAASEEMYRVLTRIHWNDEALSQIPPWIQVASKQGAVNQSRSEVLLVNGPSGDYVFSVITADQEDTSWQRNNEGYRLLRDVSRMVWAHFEPDSPWSPAEGMNHFWEQ